MFFLQIDVEAIQLMDDQTLSMYIPKAGDRVMLRQFCKPKSTATSTSKKESLFSILKKKMHGSIQFSEDELENDRKSTKRLPKLNATKQSRRIELGWMHDGKVLRTKSGGGTRKLDMPKKAVNSDILEAGKKLFFRDGRSKKGKFDHFDAVILDYQHVPMPDDVTIGDVYDISKMGIVRFYLSTKTKESFTSGNSSLLIQNDELPDIIDVSRKVTKKKQVSQETSIQLPKKQKILPLNIDRSLPTSSASMLDTISTEDEDTEIQFGQIHSTPTTMSLADTLPVEDNLLIPDISIISSEVVIQSTAATLQNSMADKMPDDIVQQALELEDITLEKYNNTPDHILTPPQTLRHAVDNHGYQVIDDITFYRTQVFLDPLKYISTNLGYASTQFRCFLLST